jgi:hypothetical protein
MACMSCFSNEDSYCATMDQPWTERLSPCEFATEMREMEIPLLVFYLLLVADYFVAAFCRSGEPLPNVDALKENGLHATFSL